MSLFQPQYGQLLRLSDELLVEILSYIWSGSDLISCSLACLRLSRLVQDKRTLKNVSFRRDVNITAQKFKQFFSDSLICSNIQGINLNSVYWLNSSLIFSNLMKMKNLARLEIADVQITSMQISKIISKLTKLERLSFTWSWTSVSDAENVSDPALSQRLSELSSLSIYISTSDICPLDKVTWMLQYCRGLKHLALVSQLLHKDVSYSGQRYNITVMIKEMKFPKLTSLILDIRNRTFPILLDREFSCKIFEALTPSNIIKFWCSSYTKREFIAKAASSLELLTISMKQPGNHKQSEPLLARQASFSFTCEEEMFHYLRSPCPNLKKLSLQHLMPCVKQGPDKDPNNRHTYHSCHNGIANIMKIPNLLEGLEELSYSTNGFVTDAWTTELHKNIGRILSSIKFQNLTKISLPLCGFLSEDDDEPNMVAKMMRQLVNKRVATNPKPYSGKAFAKFADNVPGLQDLEIVSCPSMRISKGAESVLEKVAMLSNLKTLILVKIRVNFCNISLFEKILSGCPMLSHLHINSLICDAQKFCRDLSIGLKQAGNLKTLKVFQKQWTQFSKSLFSSLSENCHKLEQLILVDSSQGFTLKRFPIEELEMIARKDSLRFLYITSELLTMENVKKLKSMAKKITSKKPFFVSRFVKEFRPRKYAFYQLPDIDGLPMVYQRSVVTINTLNSSYCSNSSVANITLEDVF